MCAFEYLNVTFAVAELYYFVHSKHEAASGAMCRTGRVALGRGPQHSGSLRRGLRLIHMSPRKLIIWIFIMQGGSLSIVLHAG